MIASIICRLGSGSMCFKSYFPPTMDLLLMLGPKYDLHLHVTVQDESAVASRSIPGRIPTLRWTAVTLL